MANLDSHSGMLTTITEPTSDESEVAAAAFLARYSGRTLDAYRYDLRTYFQWATNAHLAVWRPRGP